jgi:hypothetical protein
VRAGGGHSGRAGGQGQQDPQGQPGRASVPDPGPQMPASSKSLNVTLRSPRGHRRAGRAVGQNLAAPEPGAQRGIRGGGLREPHRVTAVLAVGVGGAGHPAPGGVHLVVGEVGPGLQAQGQERVGHRRAGHGAGSAPKAWSSSGRASGSGDGAGAGAARRDTVSGVSGAAVGA